VAVSFNTKIYNVIKLQVFGVILYISTNSVYCAFRLQKVSYGFNLATIVTQATVV